MIGRFVSALFRWPPFGEPRPVVAVVPLSGIIASGGGMRPTLNLTQLAGVLESAFSLGNAKAVVLAINSPGGSPVQSMLIHKRIIALSEEKGLPVIAFTEDVAASGGYILALAADEIIAEEASIVGSIGVVSASFGFPGLMEKLGVERRLHTSGERKSMLDPFLPEHDEDIARLKDIQAKVHEQFKALVRARRGDRLTENEVALFSGEFWLGPDAKALGLVDGLGDLRSTLRARFGKRVKLKVVQRPRRLFSLPGVGRGSMRETTPGLAREIIAAVEERALWGRFGL